MTEPKPVQGCSCARNVTIDELYERIKESVSAPQRSKIVIEWLKSLGYELGEIQYPIGWRR